MENIEKILLAIIGFVITSVIAYLFKMRQLYVALPKLYSHAPLSKNGSLVELIIYNRGNQVEEDIQVELDQSLKLDLIASSSSELKLEKSVIKIDRLHERSEQSIVLLIEEGSLAKESIKNVTSKGVKGRIYSQAHEVPPNYARAFLFTLAVFSIFPAFIYSLKGIDLLNAQWTDYKLAPIKDAGWSGLSSFHDSSLSESYNGLEFPMRLTGKSADKTNALIVYEVANKTALPLEVSALNFSAIREDGTKSPYYANVTVEPLTAKNLEIKVPLTQMKERGFVIEFLVQYGKENIVGLKHSFKANFSKPDEIK